MTIYVPARFITGKLVSYLTVYHLSLSLSLSLSLLVIVTVLTKVVIWEKWLLSMCRHPGCRGNQSKVVSKGNARLCSAVEKQQHKSQLRVMAHTAKVITIQSHSSSDSLTFAFSFFFLCFAKHT
ncbi:hypothetical protein ILYODFUR_016873 [Ilyodon furcidens]|uniref:Uncharacterized protein n=1 Tax=Ilyodon furcidens TaxID=33524 RepID=A0ABV0UH80_9TELE